VSAAATWQMVECGSYSADLPLWERLAGAAAGAVLDLGCGTGRVALHLASRGHRVTAVDVDPEMVAALAREAASRRLPVMAVCADLRSLALDRRFPLILAPMQLLQLLDQAARNAALAAIAAHLEPGGRAAIALLGDPGPDRAAPPLPDVRELEGWVYSSRPLSVTRGAAGVSVTRRRQAVSPGGELTETDDEVFLHALSPDQLAAEAAKARLQEVSRTEIGPTPDHVGSVICVLEGSV
jgi:SAM-dependent methyltransferase